MGPRRHPLHPAGDPLRRGDRSGPVRPRVRRGPEALRPAPGKPGLPVRGGLPLLLSASGRRAARRSGPPAQAPCGTSFWRPIRRSARDSRPALPWSRRAGARISSGGDREVKPAAIRDQNFCSAASPGSSPRSFAPTSGRWPTSGRSLPSASASGHPTAADRGVGEHLHPYPRHYQSGHDDGGPAGIWGSEVLH